MFISLPHDHDHQGRNQTPKGGNTLGNQIPYNTGVVGFPTTPIFIPQISTTNEKSYYFN